ncbi:uncharacterized protein LOC121274924 [Carcharodon carcharias]|uniref:uncharacterized protein LOC121274924 n=1 Tax=Carcharodon carcharias TaxID=13397 RepID=UPI001B7DDF99|nr:uncharacterized protein LOC121274924 [Carcharodon carcharias]
MTSTKCRPLLFIIMSIAFANHDPSTQPTISTSPAHPVYVEGESVTIKCAVPRGNSDGRFQLMKDSVSLLSSSVGQQSLTHTVPSVTASSEGRYTCSYQEQVSGRWIPPSLSRSIQISFTYPATQPTISSIPAIPVHVTGESVTITCTVPRCDSPGHFQLIKDSVSVMNSTIRELSLTYTIPNISTSSEGRYICTYQTKVSGRWIPSSRSQSIEILVTPFSVMLVNADDRCTGRVEIYRDGKWGTVCDDGWDIPQGRVVCNQLGCGSAISVHGGAHFGQGKGTIWVNDFACEGTESSLQSCAREWGSNGCRHGKEAGVICNPDPETEPIFSMTPSYSAYMAGESVTIECRLPRGNSTGRFQLMKGSISVMNSTSSQQSLTYIIPSITVSSEGNYRCSYQAQESGRWMRSSLSPSSEIILTQPATHPTIALFPAYPVYVAGESITIQCTIPSGNSTGRFQLLKDSISVTKSTTFQQPLTYSIPNITTNNQGTYACSYQAQMSGRWIPSVLSRSIEIIVTLTPPQPTISTGPEYPVYASGEQVRITCAAPHGTSVGRFQLLKDSITITDRTSSQPSLNYPIRKITIRDEGTYVCIYQMEVSGRWITSFPSNPMRINITRMLHFDTVQFYLKNIESFESLLSGVERWLDKFLLFGQWTNKFKLMVLAGRLKMGLSEEGNKSGITEGLEKHLKLEGLPEKPWSPTEPPLPPRIYASPNHPLYVWGETVTITCEVPPCAPVGRFQLLKGSVSVIASARSQQSLTYNISHATSSDEGPYTCFYQTQVSGRWISSLSSLAVEVILTRAPPVPRIFLDPDYPVYVAGESVTISCATPKTNSIGRLRILKDATPITSGQTEERRQSLSYPYRYISRENEGSYMCLYEIRMLGRWISSDSRASVQVNVTDPPPPPAIYLHPRHPIYLVGEDISINCLLPMSYGFGRLQWVLRWSVGDNTTTEMERRHDSVANSFITVNRDSDGNYTCLYEREVSGRWIPSIRSDVVAVRRLRMTAAISMDHESGLYMEGSTAQISCSELNRKRVSSFSFYQDNLLLRSLDVGSDHHFASLTISNFSHVNRGRYTCKCEITVLGRRLISHDSNSVFLTVRETFKPAISIRPADVEIGGNVSITCSSGREHTGVSFFLQRPGETNFTDYQTASADGHSVTFTISNLTEGDLGAYSCGYKAMVNGALLTSAISEPVEVTVNANSSTQTLFRYLSVAGVALLLLCVAAGVAATIRKKKKGSFEGPFILPDSATELNSKGAIESADSTL